MKRPQKSISTTMLFAAVFAMQQLHAFQIQNTSPQMTTALYFQNQEIMLPPSSFQAASPTSSSSSSSSLPVWLSKPQQHLVEENLALLQTAMHNFYTETETLKVIYAIEEAAKLDRQLIAGAADFLHLLVENSEIGLTALLAAAFHYCDAVRARTQHDEFVETIPSESFAPSQDIAHDAARLKKLETKLEHSRTEPQHFRSYLLAQTSDWRALAIRAGACLYRLKGIIREHQKDTRVARDALHVFAPLASRLGMHRLKNELERTAFQVLYPRQYERVNQLSHRESMQQVLEQVQGDLTQLLENDPEFSRLVEHFSVTTRVKEPFSLWKKMLRCNYQDVLQVPDAMALRIVIEARRLTHDEPRSVTQARERALCYYAQQLCAEKYVPRAEDPRFKDYIDSPKRNGYQSLHYTASYNDWTLEIQVRSMDMHRVAEFGLASHWDYKLQDGESDEDVEDDLFDVDHSTDAYARHVQEWLWQQKGGAHQTVSIPTESTYNNVWQTKPRVERIRARAQRLEPYLQALSVAQSELARDFVFVFLEHTNQSEDGKVLALPAGACVLDALREGEKTLGVHYDDSSASLNGSGTSVTRQLHNGDVLTVPTKQTLTP